MPELPNISSDAQKLGDLSLPLYEIVKRQITEAIMLGKLEPGSVLPSEVALSQTYGVAVGTIRRALMDLTNDGLLSRRRKTGTVVTGRKPQHSLRLFFQYFRLHGLDGSLSKSVTKVTSLATGVASADDARKLHIEEGAAIVSFHRVREQIGADLARDDDAKWLGLTLPAAVLTIDEVAYDQMAVPVLIAAHRATTANHRYVNEVQ